MIDSILGSVTKHATFQIYISMIVNRSSSHFMISLKTDNCCFHDLLTGHEAAHPHRLRASMLLLRQDMLSRQAGGSAMVRHHGLSGKHISVSLACFNVRDLADLLSWKSFLKICVLCMPGVLLYLRQGEVQATASVAARRPEQHQGIFEG